ncbi:MAG: hypothetical protein ABSH11_14345 [Verrucomicrobiota bacterium]
MFIALSLSAAYFFFVKNYAVGVPGNMTNGEVFTSCSLSNFQLDGLYDVWIGRLSGLLLSGQLFDFLVNHSTGNIDQYRSIFGLYHGLWLFLLFLVVILALRHSLFINLGIFAGLMYNFLPASGLYFYPWDIPATLFFTLAVLLFERRQILLMAAATCVGCFFKETVLVCALLVLFAGQWKWWKRILAFAGMVAVYVLGKKLLLNHLHIKAAVLSMNDATNWAGLMSPRILIENLKVLFSPLAIYVIFANAGSMAAVLVLGWRRRFLPYMVLILAFLAGQVMYGAFLEFRIFMQILPLSLILLSERWRDYAGSGAVAELSPESASRETKEGKGCSPTKKSPEAFAPGWAVREMFPVFLSTAIVLMVLSTTVVAWRYLVVLKNLDSIELVNNRLISRRNTSRLETACAWFQNGYVDAMLKPDSGLNSEGSVGNLATELDWFAAGYANAEFKFASFLETKERNSEAMGHYRTVLSLEMHLNTSNGYIVRLLATANNNLAWSLATASDPHLRNGDEAVRLGERACQLTRYKEAVMIGTLAAAYAEAGRWNDAVAAAQKARMLASACGEKVIAERNEQLLKLYKSGRAYHQEAKTVP